MIKTDDEEMRKSSTMNTMYIGSTISKPNCDSIIHAVSTILHSQILEDLTQGKKVEKDSKLFYFSEEKYIMENPEAFD